MKMSPKGRYAVQILLSIARFQKNGPVPKRIIAGEEGISPDYIEQIIVPLKNAGFCVGIRGVKGGFKLVKEPEEITVFQILRAAEGVMELVGCEHMDCQGKDKNKCVTLPVWAGAAEVLEEYFSKITLRDLLDRVDEVERSDATIYTT